MSCIRLFRIRSYIYMILKNVRSLFSNERILALDVDLNAIRFNICCIIEIWTHDDEKHFMTRNNYEVLLSRSAPDAHKGNNIIINSKIRNDIMNDNCDIDSTLFG